MTTKPGIPSPASAPAALILAAGMGKRMKSDLPKVLHPIGGRPMVCAVIDACREAGCGRIILIVGHKQELVRDAMKAQGLESVVEYAIQSPQLGTGHAVQCASALFGTTDGREAVFVLAGDGPLIRAETLRKIRERHESRAAAATLATSIIPDPTGYGRIVRDRQGKFAAIVEHKDCSPDQLRIREVNPSYYCFDRSALFGALSNVKKNPDSGEYYLTDVPALLLAEGRVVEVIDAVPAEDVLSINTLEQLSEVDAIYRSRGIGRVART